MGLQQGALLKDDIRAAVAREVHGAITAGRVTHWDLTVFIRLVTPRIPPNMAREMQGIAAAAEVPYRDILLLNTIPELMMSTSRAVWNDQFALSSWLNRDPPGAVMNPSGTAMAVWGPTTQNRELLVGLTMDACPSGNCQQVLWTIRRPTGANAFVGLSLAGRVGIWTGINDEQVAIAGWAVPCADEDLTANPLSWVLRRALEDSGNLRSAVMSVLSAMRSGGANILLGDGKVPEARAIEVTAHQHAVVTPMASESSLVRASHFVDEELARLQPPSLLRDHLRESHAQYDQWSDFLASNYGLMDIVRGLALLQSYSPPDCPPARILLYPARLTVWSCYCDGADSTPYPVKVDLADALRVGSR